MQKIPIAYHSANEAYARSGGIRNGYIAIAIANKRAGKHACRSRFRLNHYVCESQILRRRQFVKQADANDLLIYVNVVKNDVRYGLIVTVKALESAKANRLCQHLALKVYIVAEDNLPLIRLVIWVSQHIVINFSKVFQRFCGVDGYRLIILVNYVSVGCVAPDRNGPRRRQAAVVQIAEAILFKGVLSCVNVYRKANLRRRLSAIYIVVCLLARNRGRHIDNHSEADRLIIRRHSSVKHLLRRNAHSNVGNKIKRRFAIRDYPARFYVVFNYCINKIVRNIEGCSVGMIAKNLLRRINNEQIVEGKASAILYLYVSDIHITRLPERVRVKKSRVRRVEVLALVLVPIIHSNVKRTGNDFINARARRICKICQGRSDKC